LTGIWRRGGAGAFVARVLVLAVEHPRLAAARVVLNHPGARVVDVKRRAATPDDARIAASSAKVKIDSVRRRIGRNDLIQLPVNPRTDRVQPKSAARRMAFGAFAVEAGLADSKLHKA